MKKILKEVDKIILGSITSVMIFIIGFLWWMFEPNYKIPIWILFVIIVIYYIICIIIYAIFSSKKDTLVYRLPKVKNIVEQGEKIIFIVEKNELFSQGSYATICYQDDDDSLENILGLGYVQAINSAGFLQIEMISNLKDKNIKNTTVFRNSIKIKPSIYKELIEGVNNND